MSERMRKIGEAFASMTEAEHKQLNDSFKINCAMPNCKHKAMKNEAYCALHWGEFERAYQDYDRERAIEIAIDEEIDDRY